MRPYFYNVDDNHVLSSLLLPRVLGGERRAQRDLPADANAEEESQNTQRNVRTSTDVPAKTWKEREYQRKELKQEQEIDK